jgi:hypothetical protein
MSRRRWVQRNGELIEITPDAVLGARTNTDAILWNDRQYQDMGDQRFTSREQHREYMKQTGLTVASDYKNEWRDKEVQRNKVLSGYDPSRKEHIAKSIHKLQRA